MARVTNFFGDKEHEENEYTSNPELKALIKRMDKLEFTCHAMWLMLNKKGYTDAEFDQAMAEAVELSKRRDYHLSGIRCPSCGQNAQLYDFFKVKCIYCGEEAVMHPYEVYNMLPAEEPAPAEPAASDEPYAVAPEPAPAPEPYDINKDLNFDDL